ncbi:unnamed protein product [Closterium sp. Yama58-4]|nr:unnamed protein product [Closterium sp. Yama58-4]
MLPCATLGPLASAPATAFPASICAGTLRADSRRGGSANSAGCEKSTAFPSPRPPLARGLCGWDHQRKRSLGGGQGGRAGRVLVRAQGSPGNEGENSDEESFADVEKQLMDYFTFKAVKTVLQQLLEMNPSQYSFLYEFTVNNGVADGSTYIRTLVQERQELGERVMITRLDLFTRWKKRYSHLSMHDAIKEQNLALLREHLLQTVSPHFPLSSALSAQYSLKSASSARARGKGDGEADPRERPEPVEAEIVEEDEWDQWRGRGRAGGSGTRGAQGGFSSDEREMLRRLGAEELPPGWDSADVYLLEENVWASKPFWCQPWTIVLTGAMVVGMSWVVLHFIFVTLLVAAAIGVWWLTFLVAYPAAYKEMVQEERRRRGL